MIRRFAATRPRRRITPLNSPAIFAVSSLPSEPIVFFAAGTAAFSVRYQTERRKISCPRAASCHTLVASVFRTWKSALPWPS
jgi:hypothetical protein